MTVVVLTAVPVGLRGDLTRWLFEVAPGVFIGRVTARVRERLWSRICKHVGHDGHAVMINSARNEQGLNFRVLGGTWLPVDLDGVMLIQRSLTS
jgi:CRISPR-associated protein Cas2